jgi:hypothetical protein
MTQNVSVYNPFSSYFHPYKSYRIIRTRYVVSTCVEILVHSKIFALLYSRVGAGAGAGAAGAASKFLPGAGAA